MKKRWKIALSIVGVIALVWLLLEPIALHYLNNKLDNIKGYSGKVKDVDIYLLAGGIQIDSLTLDVTKDGFTKPFVQLPNSYASIEWKSLFKGHIVSEIQVINPRVNYEIEPKNAEDNLDEELDWVKIIKEIGKVTVNTITIENGKVNYLDRSKETDVLLFLDSLQATAKNLATIVDKSEELPSHFELSGKSTGDGKVLLKADAFLLKQIPDFDLSFEYTSVDLTAFNKAFNEYARIDMEEGSLDFFTEVALKDSSFTGYFKPILRNTKIIDWDEKEANPLRAIWEGFVGLVVKPFENQSEQQIGSKIPVEGTLTNVDEGVWTSIYYLFRNAFIEPLKREVEETISLDDIQSQSD